MTRKHQAKGIEAVAKHKKTNIESLKRCCKAESIFVSARHKKITRENMKRHCMAEIHDAAVTQKSNDDTSKKRKRQGRQHNVSTVCQDKEMTNAFKHSMKEAKRILHRTQDPANPHCHRAIVFHYMRSVYYWHRDNSQTYKRPDFSTQQ